MRLSSRAAEELLTSASDAMLVVADNGRILFANAQAEQLFGYSREELLGQPVEMLMPESVRGKHERYREHYKGAPHARPLVSGLNLEARRKNGETFSAEISLTPFEESGELLVASTIRDLSTGHASEAYFRQLLKAAPDAMIIVDENGRIAIANDQAERMFGYSRERLLGRPIEALLPEEIRHRHRDHRQQYVDDPVLRPMGTGMDLRARRADGSEFPVEISLSPVRTAGGSFVSSVIRDVSERKRMEAELIEARQAAERAHKANTAFLAAASHDLRQPVQALSLLNGALRRTVKDELAQEMVESQQNSLDAMTNLLNSLLDISRLDAGAVTPEFEVFPVRRLVDRLSAEFARQARQKELAFVSEPNGTLIRSDPNLLAEIIQNLVSNAIRYTERGQVSLTLERVNGRLSIDVRDTGIGIEGHQLDEIFREFHQLGNHGGNNEGFGLGLAIVRRLADLLGHEIVVTSEPGKGSCFSVIVPVVAEHAGEAVTDKETPTGSHPALGGTVLLVEDDPAVMQAWSLLLRAEGYEIVTARSAAEAAAAGEKLGRAPDLIVSDYHLLDDSNGIEAVEALRARFAHDIPAFIVSGDTSKVVDDARRLGNSLLMSKPVHTDNLLAQAQEAIRKGRVPNA